MKREKYHYPDPETEVNTYRMLDFRECIQCGNKFSDLKIKPIPPYTNQIGQSYNSLEYCPKCHSRTVICAACLTKYWARSDIAQPARECPVCRATILVPRKAHQPESGTEKVENEVSKDEKPKTSPPSNCRKVRILKRKSSQHCLTDVV